MQIPESHIDRQSNSIVYQADCMDVMAMFPDGYFDIASVDIPYGIDVANMSFLTETKNKIKQKNGNRLNANAKKQPYTLMDWDKNPPPQAYWDELRRVSKHQIVFGIEYVNWTGVGNGRIKWLKGIPDGVSFKKYEMAYCSLIDHEIELPLLWAGMNQAKSLSEPMTQQGNKKLNEKRIHPCHKPVMLYDALYKMFGFEGMKVLDTHLGGGSNRISCEKLNYDFTGSEINNEYFLKQKKRYRNHINNLRIANW